LAGILYYIDQWLEGLADVQFETESRKGL